MTSWPTTETSGTSLVTRQTVIVDIVIFCVVTLFFLYIEHILMLPAVYQGFMGITGSFLVVAVITWHRKQPLSVLGLARPTSLKTLPVWVIGILVATFVIAGGVQQLAATYIDAPVDLSKFAALHKNLPMLLAVLASVWITASFFEEIVYRGFLLGRLIDLLGNGRTAAIAAVVLHALLFAVMHSYQGLLGVLTTGVVAIVFGVFFLILKRNLWALIITHGLIDTLNALQFYFVGVPGHT